MKKIILFFLVILNASFTLNAQPIQPDVASQVAKNFYFERINQYKPVQYSEIGVYEIFEIKDEQNTIYYLVNIKPSGYVVVSATQFTIPVLAYSFTSSYSESGQPPQFTAWMNQYREQISDAILTGIEPPQKMPDEWTRLSTNKPELLSPLEKEKSVEPLLTSNWDQGNYYNQMCPADPAGPSGHCYTGCVATAMGQLCYFFRWPDEGVGSYSYEHSVYGNISANFEGTFYDWYGMTNSVSSQNPAVAELLFHMGVSVDMVYGPDGSGMYNHKAAYSLRTYFKYSPQTEYLYRDSTNLDWDSVIVAHLDQKIPMYYAGWSVPNINGHAFIVDGYQTEDYFHFNWGWSGSFNGYFYLDNLNPGGSNFNLAQELIIHCFPDTVSYSYPLYCSNTDTLGNLKGTIDDGSGPVYSYQNGASCYWLINPQSVQDSVTNIHISFDRFSTEENNDVLTIYDGGSVASPVLGQFSGSSIPGDLISTGNKVLVEFTSNENTVDEGWFLSYQSETPTWCDGLETITDPEGVISDGSGDFYYHNSTNCLWLIQSPDATDYMLTFTELRTEEDKDFVKIYDATTNQLLASYTGIHEQGNLPEPLFCQCSKVFIAFQSNGTITEQGWSFAYSTNPVQIKDLTSNDFRLNCFPNPVTGQFTLEIDSNRDTNAGYIIKSMNGKQIKSGSISISSGSNSYQIDLNGIGDGVYILEIHTDENSYHKKIIKTR